MSQYVPPVRLPGAPRLTLAEQCVGFLACGLFLTTSSVNSLIYSSNGAAEAAAAGYLLLAIITIIWIFYFGSEPEAAHRRFIDSFALHKSSHPSTHASRQMSHPTFGAQGPPATFNDRHVQSYTSNNQLRGFETSSPIATVPSTAFGNEPREAHAPFGGPQFNSNTMNSPTSNAMSMPGEHGTDTGDAAEYPYKAKAIYPYDANPDDANEIGFAKHEILEVSDVSGRWWQARKANGDTGIAPSNYLILL